MDFSVFRENQAIWWFYKIRGCIPTIILKMKSRDLHENQPFLGDISWNQLEIIATDDLKMKKHRKSQDFHDFDSFSVSFAIFDVEQIIRNYQKIEK